MKKIYGMFLFVLVLGGSALAMAPSVAMASPVKQDNNTGYCYCYTSCSGGFCWTTCTGDTCN